MMSKRLEVKVAIVTGASRGQGAATAALVVAEGANVVLTDLNEPSSSLINSMGSRALFLRHDVSSSSDWQEVVTRAREQFGKLDVLIHNAGVYRPGALVDTDDALWDFHYRVNQLGVFLGMRATAGLSEETLVVASTKGIPPLTTAGQPQKVPG